VRKGALRVHCGLNSHVLLLLSRLPNVIGKRLRQFRSYTSRHYAVEDQLERELERLRATVLPGAFIDRFTGMAERPWGDGLGGHGRPPCGMRLVQDQWAGRP